MKYMTCRDLFYCSYYVNLRNVKSTYYHIKIYHTKISQNYIITDRTKNGSEIYLQRLRSYPLHTIPTTPYIIFKLYFTYLFYLCSLIY